MNELETLEAIKDAYLAEYLKTIGDAMRFLPSIGLEYDHEWTNKQQQLYHTDRFNYLHLDAIERNLTPVFITLTLPSEYHQFKSDKNGGHIPNPNWDGSTVNDGYKELLRIFRSLYHNYQRDVNGKTVRETLTYSRVVEPHKDYTPHLHAVVYVEDAEKYKTFFDGVVARNKLKQVDFEKLGKAKQSIAYLLKYVGKTVNNANAEIQGWKKVHKIVTVRTSNMPFTRIEYITFKSNVKYDPTYKNYYMQMKAQLQVERYSVLDKKEQNREFFTKERKLDHYLGDFKQVSVCYSVNPTYIMTHYSLVTFRKDVLEVEFSDSTSDMFSSEPLYEYETLADMPTGNILYTCEEEEYNGCPIPVSYEQFIFEDDTESYVYRANQTRVSTQLLYKSFESLSIEDDLLKTS